MSFTERNKIFKGLRFRLTFVYSLLFGIFIYLFGIVLSKQYMDTAREDFDSALLNLALDLSEHVTSDRPGFTSKLILSATERKKHFPFSLGSIYYTIRSLKGDVIGHSPNTKKQLKIPYNEELASHVNYTHRFLDLTEGTTNYRAINLKISNHQFKDIILQVATPAEIINQLERRHMLINLMTLPLLILVSTVGAYFIAGNALSPIKSLIFAANNIAAKNLSLRVPEADTGDEVEELSKTLNSLLERLEKSFKAQENFVANASHQLNTPLAIIKGELDVLQSKDRPLDEYHKFHRSLREEIERLIELVKNMLLISRVESNQESFVMRPVRLDEIIMAITSRFSSKARDKKITIRLNISENADDSQITILGERQLLDSLFENLIDNAIKYSPEESMISLNITTHPDSTEISIRDEGPGISDEDLKKILTQRYQRGSKASLLPGTGIGLSIAKQIAWHHKALISYERLQPKGSLFTVKFTPLNS